MENLQIIASAEGGANHQPIEAGTYPARCIGMVHMGTITEDIAGQTKTLNKVRMTWELPTELKEFKEGEGEKPHFVSKEFTLSLNEKATLRKFLASWRGRDFTPEEAKAFNIVKLVGAECMLSITHKTSKNGKTYAEISSVSKLPKGMTCPAQITEATTFSVLAFNEEVFNKLPEFIREKIETSAEYKALKQNPVSAPATQEANYEEEPF